MADELLPVQAPFLDQINNELKETHSTSEAADLVFKIVEKYSTGEATGTEAVKALRATANHALESSGIRGVDILWPSFIASATQIAIAENAKK